MLLTLLKHYRKYYPKANRSLMIYSIIRGLIAFFAGYLLAQYIFREIDARFLLCFFIVIIPVDLTVRTMFQDFNNIEVVKYLQFPIRRKELSRFFILINSTNFYNFYVLLLVLPLIAKFYSAFPLPVFGLIVLVVILLSLFDYLLTVCLKILSARIRIIVIIPFLLLITTVYFALHAAKWEISGEHIRSELILGVLFLAVLIIFVNGAAQRMLAGVFYLDNTDSGKKISIPSYRKPNDAGLFFRAVWLSFIFKMTTRNKRAKSALYSFGGVCVAGLFYFINSMYNGRTSDTSSFLFITFFSIGFGLTFTQHIIGYDNKYLSLFYMTRDGLRNYLRAHVRYLYVLSLIMYAVVAPVILLTNSDILLYSSLWLFNLGTGAFAVLYKSVFNKSMVSINKSQMESSRASFNLNSLILPLFLIFFPRVMYLISKNLNIDVFYFEVFFSAVGLIFILLTSVWLTYLISLMKKQKYRILNMYGI